MMKNIVYQRIQLPAHLSISLRAFPIRFSIYLAWLQNVSLCRAKLGHGSIGENFSMLITATTNMFPNF